MLKRNSAVAAILVLVLAAPAFGQREHMTAGQREASMHHGQMAMHHATSMTAKLEVTDDAAAQKLKARVGPVKLPAHADHMAVAQPRDFFLTIPFDGWLIAFHPRLADASGAPVNAKVLHHVAFWNVSRPDFLCSNKEEHIFGAGGEMNDWPGVPGFGYRVRKGDKIRISTMFANPTETTYPEVYLDVQMEYRPAFPDGVAIKSVYPVWFDVEECRDSGYDLAPGKTTNVGKFTMKYSGELLGVGGHLHDYGRALALEDVTHKQTIAKLDPKLDPSGMLLSMPVVSFADRGGYRLDQGQVLKVTATYDNPTGKYLSEGAMGIVVGYFLPDQDSALVALERRPAR